ncbi:hypothetical protein I302_107781 [Kwoniella bestiolae CBS 10118]|uniref:Uncharacterized protein n=1 Tax=Kwoniella bestiolae CBS 10118 TaxID=1296100 RepID=A0AAJ8KEF6_9TREE
MYPYNHSIDPNAPPFNPHPHPRNVHPHPLNQNFRFPPPLSDIPQRSISQPQPQPQYPLEPYGHSRRPSQLNPTASSFSFRPLEVSSPVDNGMGRLKRYHDDASALGVDYGESGEETYERRVSPRKKALAKAMEFTSASQPTIQPINYNQTSLTNDDPNHVNYDLPPHVINPRPPHIPQPIMSTPTLHIQRDSQSHHYGSDRSMLGLGVSRSAIFSSQVNVPAQTFHTPPPPLNRAWTLDSSSRTSLSPLNHSHGGLPLTLSPLHTSLQPGRVSPSHSVISAPYDSRSVSSPVGDRRVISLSPSLGRPGRRQESISLSPSERKYRGYRAKEGGPPKAVLGGPGGKTFDEMLALKISPNLSPLKGPCAIGELSGPSRKTSGASTGSEFRYKGNPITFKLPPTSYSPPDSPPKPLCVPTSPLSSMDDPQGDKVEEEEERRPRKEAFPWPHTRIRLSPTGIPLPLSPDYPSEDTLRRPSIDSASEEEKEAREGMWNGKQVLVCFPDEDCWERLRPPTPSEPQVEKHEETEAEVSAVLDDNMPVSPGQEKDGDDARSANMVEDTIPVEETEKAEEHLPWDEYPISPTQPSELISKDNPESHARAKKENDQNPTKHDPPQPFTLTPHPSLPPRPITRDDPPPTYTSPSSDLSSPSKRSFSGAALGNADFLRKHLGGVLKDPEEIKERRDSTSSHARGRSKGSVGSGSWKQYDHPEDQALSPNVGPSPKGKSKMRAWSDNEAQEDEMVWEEENKESVSGPARLENTENVTHQIYEPHEEEQDERSLGSKNVDGQGSPATVMHDLGSSSGSKMRAWSDDDVDMGWEEEDAAQGFVFSPARLERPSVETRQFNMPTRKETPDHGFSETDEQAIPEDVHPIPPLNSGTKMRAWSDDRDKSIYESVSSPARIEGNSDGTVEQPGKDLEPQQVYAVDSIYPGSNSRLHAWTPSPEPSKMRAWGLEEDINPPHEEAVTEPDNLHRKNLSEEVDRWQNDRFDRNEEFEDVPLTATEASKMRPWEQSGLGIVEEVHEGRTNRLEKRARDEDLEEDSSKGGSKMRAWSEDLPTSTIQEHNPVRWAKNGEETKELPVDYVKMTEGRPAALEEFRRAAIKSKEIADPEVTSLIKLKALREQVKKTKGSKKKGKKNGSAELTSMDIAEAINAIQEESHPQTQHKRSVSAKEGNDLGMDNSPGDDHVVPSSPHAKRLRPTAESWRPPQPTPAYGALGISSIPPKSSSIVPSLPPNAKPFVPRSTSFNFTVPVVNPNAPSFVPRASSFTFVPPHSQPMIPSAPPFVPATTPFNFVPPAIRPPFTPSTAPFVPSSAHKRPSSAASSSSTQEKKLRPTASAFIPPQPSPTKGGGFTFTFPSTTRDRAASIASSNGENRLRPTASTFIPSRALAKAATKPRLQPSAIPFVPPASVASRDTATSPVKSLSTSQTRSDDVGDSTASTILVTSPHKADTSVSSDQPTQDRSEEDIVGTEDLARVSSSDEPILTLAEIEFEQHRPASVDSGLQVVLPGRGRADTVAFGPSSPIGDANAEVEELQSQSEQEDEERIEDSVVDLEGLFFDTPILTTSSVIEQDVLGVREASPRLSVGERESRTSENGRMSERSRSTSTSSERPPRDDRPSAKREQENSYHPLDTPTLPLTEPVIPLKQITIHPSHPVQLPLTPRPNVEEVPDAPVSAHTTALSNAGSVGSDILSHTARPSLSRPLPPIPSTKEITPSTGPFTFSSPARADVFTTPPQSTGDTFASAAYMTADGSPLIPTRIFVEAESTPPKRVRRPLPDIPTWREPIPVTASVPSTSNGEGIDPVEVLEDYQGGHKHEEDNLVYPKVDVDSTHEGRERERGFDRSAAPSPELPVPSEVDEIEPSPDPLMVNTKFREWTFPLSSPDKYEDGHHPKPSIIRRHTMPAEDHLDELDSPPVTTQGTFGIASTFASRVGELRAFLRADEEGISRRTSVEFPMRENTRKLGVVNVDRAEVETPLNPAKEGQPISDRLLRDERLDEVLGLLKKWDDGGRVQEDMKGLKDGIVDAVQGVISRLQTNSSKADVLERVTSILEEHSRLLSSLNDTVNVPATPQRVTEDQSQSQSKDLFAAILTGQHAILDKFDEVASSQLSGSSTITQAIEALQYAQNAAEQRAQEIDQQRSLISALREEIEDNRVTISESRAQADVLNQRLKDTRQDRDELRFQIEGMQVRVEGMSIKHNRLEGELDGVVARALAAELERDALARVINERRDEEDGLRSQLREYQEQLGKERSSSTLALNAKESEIVAMQSQIHTQISQLSEEKEKIQSLEQTLLRKEAEAQEEEDKPKPATEGSIIEMAQNALTFQEELMGRLSKLDENMYESMGSRVKEYEGVLDRNRILQGEVDSLRERLEASADRFAKLQLSTSNALSANAVAQQSLSDKLSEESKRREDADSKMEEMKRELDKVKEEKMNWNVIAAERQAMARMQEVRLQALTQENVYWRQFALEHDRRRFKGYMSTKPFRNGDGSEMMINGTSQGGGNEGTWYVEKK